MTDKMAELKAAYPTYEQVESFAEDFRKGAAAAYAKGDHWARYWLDPTLNILTTLLKGNICAVVAYPPAGWEDANPDEVAGLEYFRGWILEYHPATGLWTLEISSQEIGIDDFMLLRQELKANQTAESYAVASSRSLTRSTW